MDNSVISYESHIIDAAMNDFIDAAITANQKVKKLKQNMLYRRKLELKKEDFRLRKETCEFEFELSALG